MIKLELRGIEVFGHHGLLPEEKRQGQTFWFDVDLEVSDKALSDRIDDAVDYREVYVVLRSVSDGRSFDLLETLAASAADALASTYPLTHVRVKVRKRPGDLPLEHAAAIVERSG
jgi:7,8-dihydroneopterin aldolase/epimerase/oxygenase